MKISVKKPRKIKRVVFGGKLYGKLILTLEELTAYTGEGDEVNIVLEVNRVNPDAVPN